MAARLHNKLPNIFLRPLFYGILFSLLSTIFYLIFYVKNVSSSTEIMSFIRQADRDKSDPILYNIQNILCRKFQGTIDALMAFKQYYKYLAESNDLNLGNRDEMQKFISEFSFNGVETYKNFNKTIELMTANNNETYLDYSIWYINPEVTSLDKVDYITLKQIFVMTNMNLMLRSHYELTRSNPIKGFKNIYIGFSYSNLFYKYPVPNSANLLAPMQSMSNDPWCRDDDMAIPNYFYIKCRPWYKESLIFYNDLKLDVTITAPYKIEIITNRLGITTCIRVEDSFAREITSNANFLVICIDQDMNDMFYSFEEYNNLLAGYYFMFRIKSNVPIYYPKLMDTFYATDIYQYEFNLNTTFFVNEVFNYKQTLDILTASMNNTEDMKIFTSEGIFYRDNKQELFYIYPLLLNVNDDPEVTNHLLSIIYITNSDAQSKLISKTQNNLIANLIFQTLLLLILGSILFLISRYLLVSIALNIVKPIKLMKRLIEGMNNKKISLMSTSALNQDDDEDEEEEEMLMENNENLNGLTRKDTFYNRNNEHEEEDIEDYLGTRSKDIENLFDNLINLKKVVSFTQDTTLNTENESILNFLFAQYTFKEVNNEKAKFLCDSNVGNLTIKCHKYDKAIFHLLESLKDPTNDTANIGSHVRLSKFSNKKNLKLSISNNKNINESLKQSIMLSYGKHANSSDITTLVEKSQQKAETFKKKFLNSRYPKLIYSFKKYYKNIRKLTKSHSIWDSLTMQDFYALSEKHSLEQYEKVLSDYIKLSNDFQEENKFVEALLEHSEFLINYRLRSPKSHEITTLDADIDVRNMKTDVIKQILSNFKRIDFKLKKLKATASNEYLKKILDMINVLKKESVEMIDNPIHVLIQKANFLKGKFFYYCENYSQALRFFNESKKINIISNAKIIKSSLKKIEKIVKIFSKRIKIQLSNLTAENNFLRNVAKEKLIVSLKDKNERLSKYRTTIREFIKNYNSYPKDIAILINVSNPIKDDSKKLVMSLKIALNIFDNFTTSDDRFCVFSYSINSNPLINLIYKNVNTVDYIKYQIESYMQSENSMQESETQSESSSLIRNVSSVLEYLEKKNYCTGKIREKWLIAITEDISDEDINFIKNNDLKEKLFEGNNNDSLIILTLNKSNIHSEKNELIESLRSRFTFNKSDIIDMDKMEHLKRKMKIIGTLNDDGTFLQERYEKSVKTLL